MRRRRPNQPGPGNMPLVAEIEARAGERMIRESEQRAASRELYACAAIFRAFSVLQALTPKEEDMSIHVVVCHYDDRGDPDPPNNYRAEMIIGGKHWIPSWARTPVTKEAADRIAAEARAALEAYKASP